MYAHSGQLLTFVAGSFLRPTFTSYTSLTQGIMAMLHITHLLLALCLLRPASSDFASDEAECADKLVGLMTCRPYVQGNTKAPTPDCCSGLKTVVSQSTKCLCILVKDRDNPQLKIKINATLALTLPSVCAVPSKVSDCPRLLNLPPNSPDAQIFQQFANTSTRGSKGKGNTILPGSQPGTATVHASCSRRNWWGGRLEMLVVLMLVLSLAVMSV